MVTEQIAMWSYDSEEQASCLLSSWSYLEAIESSGLANGSFSKHFFLVQRFAFDEPNIGYKTIQRGERDGKGKREMFGTGQTCWF